jgi:DNA polymerase alpha subunit A
VVGHNILGFDLDVLLHRIKHHNVPHWSRLGRLRRSQMPKLSSGTSGRASYQVVRSVCGVFLTLSLRNRVG